MMRAIAGLLPALALLAGAAPGHAQTVTTPGPGSAERKAILDAVRPSPNSGIRFIVHELRLVRGRTSAFAYAVVEPSRGEYDGGEFILERREGWRVIWSITGGGTDTCDATIDYYRGAIAYLARQGIAADLLKPGMTGELAELSEAAKDPDCQNIGDLGAELPAEG